MDRFLTAFFTVTLALSLAGFIAAAQIRWPRSRSDRTSPEPVGPPPPSSRPTMRLPLVRRGLHRRSEPPAHVGATTRWSPAREVAQAGQAPELVTAPEQMVADHRALDPISDAIAVFDAVIERELDRFLAGLPMVRMRLAAGAADTGEMPALRAVRVG